jgi:hypothetical protein
MGLLRRLLLSILSPATATSERHMARWYVGRLTEWRSAVIEMQRLHAKCIAQGVPSDALRMHTEREALSLIHI